MKKLWTLSSKRRFLVERLLIRWFSVARWYDWCHENHCYALAENCWATKLLTIRCQSSWSSGLLASTFNVCVTHGSHEYSLKGPIRYNTLPCVNQFPFLEDLRLARNKDSKSSLAFLCFQLFCDANQMFLTSMPEMWFC